METGESPRDRRQSSDPTEWEVDRILSHLERSKYAMRIILLLYRNREMTLYGILRSIPASPPTIVRSLRVLAIHGFLAGRREAGGRKRHFHSLTHLGLSVAVHPPIAWGLREGLLGMSLPQGHWSTTRPPGSPIMLHLCEQCKEWGDDQPGGNTGISFATDDKEQTYREL